MRWDRTAPVSWIGRPRAVSGRVLGPDVQALVVLNLERREHLATELKVVYSIV
jgi:hypothetical protein